ncbi:MAG: hypothetical protein ACLFVO_19565 [Chloroflexaceae bacterium]
MFSLVLVACSAEEGLLTQSEPAPLEPTESQIQTEETAAGLPQFADARVIPEDTLSEIDDNPEAYLGETVTVQGDVTEVISANAFRFDDPAPLGGDDILVVGRGESGLVAAGTTLLVTGVVRQFDLAAVAEESGLDLQEARFAGFTDETVIVATTIVAAGTREAQQVAVTDLVENSDAYLGQTVTTRGILQRNIHRRALVLRDPNQTSGGMLLVVGATENAIPVEEGVLYTEGMEQLQATGVLRRFDLTAIEAAINVDLDDNMFAEFTGRPTLVADVVTQWSPMDERTETGLLTIAGNTDALLGQTVTVDAEITEILSPQVFRINNGNLLEIQNEVLVVDQTASPGPALAAGMRVEVTGMVRRFVRDELEADFALGLQPSLYTDYANRPAIVAVSLTPVE